MQYDAKFCFVLEDKRKRRYDYLVGNHHIGKRYMAERLRKEFDKVIAEVEQNAGLKASQAAEAVKETEPVNPLTAQAIT